MPIDLFLMMPMIMMIRYRWLLVVIAINVTLISLGSNRLLIALSSPSIITPTGCPTAVVVTHHTSSSSSRINIGHVHEHRRMPYARWSCISGDDDDNGPCILENVCAKADKTLVYTKDDQSRLPSLQWSKYRVIRVATTKLMSFAWVPNNTIAFIIDRRHQQHLYSSIVYPVYTAMHDLSVTASDTYAFSFSDVSENPLLRVITRNRITILDASVTYCFPKLLITQSRIHTHKMTMPLSIRLRNMVWNSIGIVKKVPACSQPHVIVSHSKGGRRDVPPVAGARYIDISMMNEREQAEAVSGASVFISSDDVTMRALALLLPNHATAVFDRSTVFPTTANLHFFVYDDTQQHTLQHALQRWYNLSGCDRAATTEWPTYTRDPTEYLTEFTDAQCRYPVYCGDIAPKNVFGIMMSVSALHASMMAVTRTWGRRMRMQWFIEKSDEHIECITPITINNNVTTKYAYLQAKLGDKLTFPIDITSSYFHFWKTIWVYEYMAKAVKENPAEFSSFDWYYKGFEDVYMLTENIQQLLQQYDPNEALILGEQQLIGNNVFLGGGTGWFISRAALLRMDDLVRSCLTTVMQANTRYPSLGWRADDALLSICFKENPSIGIRIVGAPGMYMFPPWSYDYDGEVRPLDLVCGTPYPYKDNPSIIGRNESLRGALAYPVTFHKMSPDTMPVMERVLYSSDGSTCNEHRFKQ